MLEFILNILCDVIHDIFLKYVYDTVCEKLSTFCILMYPPENCPPNCPDLNPVDYSIWAALQQLVYHQQVQDIEHLKNVLVKVWNKSARLELIELSDSFRND